MLKIAIIGAGVAGLTLAHKLKEAGYLQVEIFDKGKAPGGRTSSRRIDQGYLDHGAQFLTIKDLEFREFLASHLPQELIVRWDVDFALWQNGKFIPKERLRYVPLQSMSALCKQLAVGLSVKTQVRITSLERQWQLLDEQANSYGPFDLVVLTAPPAQSCALLKGHSDLAQEVSKIQMWPCWSLMLTSSEPVVFPFAGIEFEHPVLGWIGLNHTKAQRGKITSFIVQANWNWSKENLESDPQQVTEILYREFLQVMGLGDVNYKKIVHLWRYASPVEVANTPYLLDQANGLALCGDWCVAGKIEGAFISANELAKKIINS